MSDMFQGEATTQTAQPEGSVQPTVQPASDNASVLLDAIVDGEGRRKYADVTKALASIPHKEAYIAKLEGENKMLREEADRLRGDVERLSAKLETISTTGATSGTGTGQPTVSPLDIEGLVAQQVERLELAKTKQQRQQAVKDSLLQKFGQDAAKQWKAKADELGVTPEFLTDMAGHSPKAVLAYFENVQTAQDVKPTTGSSVNSEALKSKPKMVSTAFSPRQPTKAELQMREIREQILAGLN